MLVTEKQTDSLIVKPQGKITAASVDEFRKELNALVEAGETNLTIDLAEVDMIDSKGLAVFIVCHQTLAKKGGNLTVICDNADIRGLFHVMRLDERFTVKESS